MTNQNINFLLLVNHTQPAPRNIRNRSKKFDKNIGKRGAVSKKPVDEEEEKKLNPYLLAMFVFLVCGSSLVSVLRLFTVKSGVPKDE